MKIILNFFLLHILILSPVFADTHLDLDFEGIKIGDSLLSYMTKEEILNEIEYNNSVGQNYRMNLVRFTMMLLIRIIKQLI